MKQAVGNLTPVIITPAQELEGIPLDRLSVGDYIQKRVDQQINEYYIPQARANDRKVTIGKRISVILGALAVVLGLLNAKYNWTAGWTAVIGTITAAIAARQYAGRYQFLIVSYQATAERLKWLKTQWEIDRSSETDIDAINRFIMASEEAISIENTAWMAEWTKQPDKT